MRKRSIEKTIWLSIDEDKILKQNSKKVGLNESEYLRSLITGYKPKEQPTESIFEMLSQMRGIGANLNQIAKKANALNLIDAPYYKRVYEKWLELETKIKDELLDMEKEK